MISSYKTLFQLQFTHHYFLDEGTEVYGVDMTAEQEAKNLRLYEVSSFFRITPSTRTEKLLKNWRSRLVRNKDGISILTKTDGDTPNKPFIGFQNDLYFDFIIHIKDKYFENYTDIEINRSKLVFISNAAPTPAAVNSKTYSEIQHVSLSNFGDAYTDLNTELSEDISSNETIGAWGIVRIHLNGDVGEISLSNGSGEFAGTTPTPELILKNRKTKWRFIDANDGTVLKVTNKKPLTKNGYITVKKGGVEFPNPKADLIILESGKYFSEVFV